MRARAYYEGCPPSWQELGFDGAPAPKYYPISGFKDLVSLELYSLAFEVGKSEDLIEDFAKALLRSQHLKTLGMSFASRWDPIGGVIATSTDPYFLYNLSKIYSSLGGAPLLIETLRLGEGIVFDEIDANGVEDQTPEEADSKLHLCKRQQKRDTYKYTENHYVHKLWNNKALTTFHAYNGPRLIEGHGLHLFNTIDFLYTPSYPNLRQLAVNFLITDVTQWLNHPANNVTELIVTGCYAQLPCRSLVSDFDEFSKLHLPLTLLYARELYTESSGRSTHDSVTILRALTGLRTVTLQSLALSVDESQLVNLSRLIVTPYIKIILTRWQGGLIQDIHFLPNLTFLRLLKRAGAPKQFFNPERERLKHTGNFMMPLWIKNGPTPEMVAKHCFGAQRALKYVMVDQVAFEVVHNWTKVDGDNERQGHVRKRAKKSMKGEAKYLRESVELPYFWLEIPHRATLIFICRNRNGRIL